MTFQHLLKHQQSCFPSQSQRCTLNPAFKKESGLFSAIHLLGLNVKQTGSDILYSRSCWWSRPLTFMFATPLSFPLLPSTPLPSNSHRGSYALFVPCGLLCSSFMKSWSRLSHHPPPKIATEESERALASLCSNITRSCLSSLRDQQAIWNPVVVVNNKPVKYTENVCRLKGAL